MERTPAAIRHKLGPHPHDLWLSAQEPETPGDADSQAASQGAVPETSVDGVVKSDRANPTMAAARTRAALPRWLRVPVTALLASTAILASLGLVAVVPILLVPAVPVNQSAEVISPAVASQLLVWLPGLGACLALVVHFEGERLRAFIRRIRNAVVRKK